MVSALFTDRGDREYNEDAAGIYESRDSSLYVLCDGLGGQGMGDAASELVCKAFNTQFAENIPAGKFLKSAFMYAQTALREEQNRLHAIHKMRTTAVACLIEKGRVYIGHVGDSRCYLFRKGHYQMRTIDHSIPQMLVLAKKIDESQIRHHPQRSVVLKAMGEIWESPQYTLLKPFRLKKDDCFLLCSDGFWELIPEEDMERLLAEASSPEEWIDRMTKVVRANGAGKNMDNYTAVAVWNR